MRDSEKLSLLSRVRTRVKNWRSKEVQTKDPLAADEKPSTGALQMELSGHEVVFGLNWVPAKPDQVRSVFAQARTVKMQSHVSLAHLIGLSTLPAKSKGRRNGISAALVLSEGASIGGSEVYAFELGHDLYSLIALEESAPVPGFDITGSHSKVKLAADNYLRLPHRGMVRRCGSREILDDAELLNLDVVLEDGDFRDARLKVITDYSKAIRYVLATLVLGFVAGGVYLYLSHANRQAEQERLARENDPDLLYEKAFAKAVSSLGPLGSDGLKSMLSTAKRIPLACGGWLLAQVSCTATECKARWNRLYGSYADFEANLPKDVTTKPTYVYLSKGDANLKLETVHPNTFEKNTETLATLRSTLPVKFDAQIDLVSQMQDYSLAKLNATVEAPIPFISQGEITKIFRPVLSGAWTATGDLWQLEDFRIPNYAILDTLQISNLENTDKKSETNFVMSGRYFVKGKNFN
jgi:hypothetical protein